MRDSPRDIGGSAFEPGDIIGHHEVRQVLCVGGKSIVYKCYDPRLERLVAIKQIAKNLAGDQEYLDQFNKSVCDLARFGSMNEDIVTIHEVIQNKQGLFYVMEFVQGHTLETFIQERAGPIESKAVLLIIYRLAAALSVVHCDGIVHRDVRPAKIILGDGLRPKIIDFGVAPALGVGRHPGIGTTKYLAPEINGGTGDCRSDLYSLGFIAYEMLIGRAKFNEIFADVVSSVGDNSDDASAWLKWHGDLTALAPPLHEINPSISNSLSELIARMMCKNPASRFASADELSGGIRSSLAGG